MLFARNVIFNAVLFFYLEIAVTNHVRVNAFELEFEDFILGCQKDSLHSINHFHLGLDSVVKENAGSFPIEIRIRVS